MHQPGLESTYCTPRSLCHRLKAPRPPRRISVASSSQAKHRFAIVSASSCYQDVATPAASGASEFRKRRRTLHTLHLDKVIITAYLVFLSPTRLTFAHPQNSRNSSDDTLNLRALVRLQFAAGFVGRILPSALRLAKVAMRMVEAGRHSVLYARLLIPEAATHAIHPDADRTLCCLQITARNSHQGPRR